MTWHYIENGQQAGPVDDATFASMVNAGRITPNTHVWREGMPDWAPYTSVVSSGGSRPVIGAVQCAECGNAFPVDELVQIGNHQVCSACKPIAVQKLREGVLQPVTAELHYAGFWMRVVAAFVDFLVLFPIGIVLGLAFGLYQLGNSHQYNPVAHLGMNSIGSLIQLSYSAFLLGRYGGTLGMMACGIRVVRSSGEAISYLRAIGRYFANLAGVIGGMTVCALIGGLIGAVIISIVGGRDSAGAIIIMICVFPLMMFGALLGYLIVPFDKQKRAIHDFICDTRVVYKR